MSNLLEFSKLDELKFRAYSKEYQLDGLSSSEALELAIQAEQDYNLCAKNYDPIAGRMKQTQLAFTEIAILLEKQGR